ncbi:MAG: redoxin domain-containing protein [Ruminococcaceae bacterium]|nr:redoxin domain-containing protein [Oscillospiraceae bacterium]
MKKTKQILSMILAVAIMLSMASMLFGCDNSETPDEGTQPTTGNSGAVKTYLVNVQTAGGMPMAGLDVYIYSDNMSNLEKFGQTDANGNISFDMPEKSDYMVALAGAPKGYEVADSYSFTGTTAAIRLNSSLIKDDSLSSATLALGSVMYDFTVTTHDGKTITLSELLKEKEMVLLNFWYTTCTWCLEEFPYMEEAYQMYKDKIEIVALNPFEADPAIKSFQESNNLTFPMASCNAGYANAFGISGYPTSVVVDRYGVVCLIESGGITSLRPFTSIFDYFTGDDYKQKLCTSLNELVTAVKPTQTMPSNEEIGAAINNGDITVTYRPEEGEGAEFSWPFVLSEKGGETCLKASNQSIDDSYAIIYADVTLKAGQAVGFDYWASTENLADILYVIVDGEDIYSISGTNQTGWKSCYPWVALEDGEYEIALCYLKDESGSEGEDTVYIKNMCVIDAKDIDVPTYIPRQAATTEDDGFTYNYVDVVFNSKDGYYHVGTANGPLLLADLMGYTQFNEEQPVFSLVYDNNMQVDGKPYYDVMLDHFTLASNSSLFGICTVTSSLAEQLKVVASHYGFDGTDNEWLKVCKYFQVYGTNNAQLQDPIAGLAPFCAYTATLGKNVASNYFYYDRPIIPRGSLAKFVPTKSGVYRFTSKSDYAQGIEGWIHDENGNVIYTYEYDERLYEDTINVSMLYYMEAGKTYFINMAFWDVYATGYINYDVEFVGTSYDLFRLASPGYFTYDADAEGENMYYTISGGIKVALGKDGYYHEDLGGGKLGSIVYADFYGLTLFDTPIATNNGVMGMIDKGAFDFSKNENDMYILAYLKKNNNDVDATLAELKTVWGEDYDANYLEYQVDDILSGIYHGRGKDYTATIKTYLSKIITSGKAELIGCVPVTAELADILQLLMEKYTFDNVECSWPKLCYYYDTLSAAG